MATDPQMTMNRVIHAAVRRDFERTAKALDAFRDGDTTRAAELARAWDHLAHQLTHHHEQEDTLIWPALESLGVDPVLLGEMESEHQAMHDALEETSGHMKRLGASARNEDATVAAEALEHTRTVTERHLRHEEDELEPQLLQHVESPEWKLVERRLRKQPLGVAGGFFAWVLDGLPPREDAYVRSAVPTPVVFLLSRVVGLGYRRRIAPVWRH
ncbi:hemerythrin domain-containing protein [Nocardioides sp. HDW12B]|uniref:hemerythrin domain-containing protein n=1 Tax=Nocardioides sp. HDW12B TaxID=2714939 RepID=UPI0014080F39|nr:hemerythrin domain-containing protein [Nocardioides sp. HDW12B]QIK66867.1 hemerythrin domain-containing protein [Nocardioides sp. HDW12B]